MTDPLPFGLDIDKPEESLAKLQQIMLLGIGNDVEENLEVFNRIWGILLRLLKHQEDLFEMKTDHVEMLKAHRDELKGQIKSLKTQLKERDLIEETTIRFVGEMVYAKDVQPGDSIVVPIVEAGFSYARDVLSYYVTEVSKSPSDSDDKVELTTTGPKIIYPYYHNVIVIRAKPV